MKVYEVNAKDDGTTLTFATKREAITEARHAARKYAPEGELVEVDEITLAPIDKALIVRLINGAGKYVVGRRTVFTLRAKRDWGSGVVDRENI